jgi:hypothetical protein
MWVKFLQEPYMKNGGPIQRVTGTHICPMLHTDKGLAHIDTADEQVS